ncbi:SRPBCC domain-containing protein [uncultured Shimia sp.]|uniref:SRPBCC domain-containing protein n=1 Tax=uncultured Shimia sp. TaxID=573152 RepID=UPI002617D601|nr:SRPBCC domain-containing protein [uncultured Shimia sp.]
MALKMELLGETQILVTRFFAAPPATVYTAHTDPDLVAKWMLGPPGWALSVKSYDARPNGKIHLVWTHPDEGELALTGSFLELEPPHKTVHTEQFQIGAPSPINTVTTHFEAEGDGCLLRVVIDMPDAQAREETIAMGMEEGMEASYGQLDALLSA